ncbi:MAG TPA: ABC transporter substrate-binding protein [Thermoleophilaceae bacterium]|nr:ABC transporter substrate-binding protein [Thermoleophilaceae bacterium]
MTRRLPAAVLAALVLAAALVAAGCGSKTDRIEPSGLTSFELMLDYFPNADHSEIYAAKAAGYFKQAGLDVKIRTPNDPSVPIKQVAAGRVDLAISYEPELLRARDDGLHVISVGALVQKPLTSIISLNKPAITRPGQLAGKTVGTAGIDYQSAYLKTILAHANVPQSSVKVRNVGFNLVPALVTRKVDAILGGYWNYEAVQLRLANKHPHVLRLEQVGVPNYNELVLVANSDRFDQEKKSIQRFIGALSRGLRLLKRDPNGAIQGLLKANPDLEPKLQRQSLQVTLPAFEPPSGKPFGWQDPAQWGAFAAWMNQNGILKHGTAAGAFTNSLLPGEGL